MRYRRFFLAGILFLLPVLFFSFQSVGGSLKQKLTIDNRNQANFAILPRFDTPGQFNEGLAPVKKGQNWGFINKKGNWKIQPHYEAAKKFQEGLAAVRTTSGWGYINQNGDWHILPKFDRAKSYSNGLAAVKKGNDWGYINKKGQQITDYKYDWTDNFKNERAVVTLNNSKGFLNRDGKPVIKLKFQDAGHYSNGVAPVKTEEGWGYIDRNGAPVMPFKYDWATPSKHGLMRVLDDTHWSFAEKSSKKLTKTNHTFVSQPGFEGLIRIKHQNKVGFLNSNFDTVVEPRFDQALSFNGKFTPAKKDGLWGYINTKGQWVIRPKFSSAGPFHDKLAPVKVNETWGYIPKPNHASEKIRTTNSKFWIDTGTRGVNPEAINSPLEKKYPTWRYERRERYVRVLKTRYKHWEMEINVPKDNFGKSNARYEVTRFPYKEPTYLQLDAAESFYWRALKTAENKQWFFPKKGYEDGYGKKLGIDSHFFNKKFMLDAELMTPSNPETLIYYKNKQKQRQLAGLMFYHNNRKAGGPQIGGPLTVWHYHVFDEPICHEEVVVQPFDSECEQGVKLTRSPEMIHTWFIQHPAGTFGTTTKISDSNKSNFSLAYEPRSPLTP